MMKKNLWLLGGLVAMAFSACTNEDSLPNNHTLAPVKKVQVTAYAPGDEVESRVAFSENGGAISLAWENEESFSVIWNNGDEDKGNVTFSKNSVGNVFDGELPAEGTGPYYAIYPKTTSTDYTDYTAVPYDLSSQTGVLNGSNPYMYATSTDGKEFHFQQAAALLKATFSGLPTGATISGLPTGAAIKKVKVFLPDNKAKGTINLNGGVLTGTDGYNLITINYATPVDATTTASYICLPPMSKDNKTLVFMVTTGNEKTYTAILAGDNTKDIEAGKVYTANINLTEVQSSCNLPLGSTFNSSVSSFLSGKGLTKIKFIADPTWNVSGTEISTSGAYMVENGETLEIRTNAVEFVFHSNSDFMFCGYMYYRDTNFRNLSSIDFNDCVNTANVTTMYQMFEYCEGLTELDLSNFNTANVANMKGMFKDCQRLTKLNLSNFNTAKVTDMYQMFENCQSLTELDLRNFNTEKVVPMDKMFYNCQSLTELDLSMFYTPLVKNMAGMFQNCYALTSLDIRNFYINNVTNFYNIFYYVGKNYYNAETGTKTLVKVNSELLGKFNERNVSTGTYAKYESID